LPPDVEKSMWKESGSGPKWVLPAMMFVLPAPARRSVKGVRVLRARMPCSIAPWMGAWTPVRSEVRAGLQTGTGTAGQCDGTLSQDLNAHWCPGCPKPSHNPGAGATVQAQLWYRDALNTSNQTTSFSDAIEFVLAP